MVLNNENLYNIKGGASAKNWGIGILLSAIGTLIVGIIDGYLRPLKCNV